MKLFLITTVLALTFGANALTITTLSTPQWIGGNNANLNAAQIAAIVGISTLTEVYKQDVGGADSGTFSSSYTTTFLNSSSDPEDALIDYISGQSISGGSIFLYVKDGDQQPAFYVFDISGWNGTEDIVLDNFWPQQGAISHIAILTGAARVPDSGTTVALLGVGLLCLNLARRKFAK